jgi:hypothetical protein
MAEKSWLRKIRSHDHGINSKGTIPDRIHLTTKYRGEMYYYNMYELYKEF